MAQRTIEQRQVIVNNLAIRRGSDRLARVDELAELYRILQDTFRSNDFDGFELQVVEPLAQSNTWNRQYRWTKPATPKSDRVEPGKSSWELSLDLTTHAENYCGRFVVHRAHGRGGLKVDINLLLEEFRLGLADALERCSTAQAPAPELLRPMPERVRAAASSHFD